MANLLSSNNVCWYKRYA